MPSISTFHCRKRRAHTVRQPDVHRVWGAEHFTLPPRSSRTPRARLKASINSLAFTAKSPNRRSPAVQFEGSSPQQGDSGWYEGFCHRRRLLPWFNSRSPVLERFLLQWESQGPHGPRHQPQSMKRKCQFVCKFPTYVSSRLIVLQTRAA